MQHSIRCAQLQSGSMWLRRKRAGGDKDQGRYRGQGQAAAPAGRRLVQACHQADRAEPGPEACCAA